MKVPDAVRDSGPVLEQINQTKLIEMCNVAG